MKVTNPHDKYFKAVFSKKEEAIDLIKNSLSKEIVSKLNLNSLKLENTSYITKQLKELFSDLVFSCQCNEVKIMITILFEHKSYVPKHPHLQLMEYMCGIWRKESGDKIELTRVIPIFIYHGKKSWKIKHFHNSFNNKLEETNRYIPEFDYAIIDLSKYTDDQIQKNFKQVYARTSLLLLKNYLDEVRLKQNLFLYLSNLKELRNQKNILLFG
jgi:predicted transposase/invertase (TIGR01784 family)